MVLFCFIGSLISVCLVFLIVSVQWSDQPLYKLYMYVWSVKICSMCVRLGHCA